MDLDPKPGLNHSAAKILFGASHEFDPTEDCSAVYVGMYIA